MYPDYFFSCDYDETLQNVVGNDRPIFFLEFEQKSQKDKVDAPFFVSLENVRNTSDFLFPVVLQKETLASNVSNIA